MQAQSHFPPVVSHAADHRVKLHRPHAASSFRGVGSRTIGLMPIGVAIRAGCLGRSVVRAAIAGRPRVAAAVKQHWLRVDAPPGGWCVGTAATVAAAAAAAICDPAASAVLGAVCAARGSGQANSHMQRLQPRHVCAQPDQRPQLEHVCKGLKVRQNLHTTGSAEFSVLQSAWITRLPDCNLDTGVLLRPPPAA